MTKGKPPNRRHVTQTPQGGWQVREPGQTQPESTARTQQQAIDQARDALRQTGGGELTVHGRDGQIRDSDTVPPAHDPFPPRDKR